MIVFNQNLKLNSNSLNNSFFEIIKQEKMQYNKAENQRLLKILIIGNSGVGKSCMLMRYVQNSFTTAFYNTIGVDFVTGFLIKKMKNIELDGRKVRMQIWDTAGQDRFRTITSTYYKGAHGIILVYDVTDRQSFDGLKFWIQEIQKYASENVDKIIVANKSDAKEKRKVTSEQGQEFAKAYKLEFIEVSALSSTNIGEAFDTVARKILKRLENAPIPVQRIPQKLQQKKNQNNSGGCC